MPELDLEGEGQVSHRKKSLRPGENLPNRGNSVYKGSEPLIFQRVMVDGL